MKWQAIANVTSDLNKEARDYFINKLTQDAAVEAPNLWSGIITATTKHLRDSQSHLEVTTDEKTGSLTCLTNFDAMHEDFLEHGKPFANYALSKYDQRASDILSQTKNPFTRKFLEQRIGNYRMSLAENLSHTEVKLIDGKRHSMAIDAIEKLKNATYDNPHLYSQNLEDGLSAIVSLSLLPQEKEQLMHSAREELAYAAGLSTLRRSPQSILITDEASLTTHAPWKGHLSFEQRIRLENQAHHTLEQNAKMRERQITTLAEINFDNILETGEESKGFSSILNAVYSAVNKR